MKTNLQKAKVLPGQIKVIEQSDIDDALNQAREHPRRRSPILLNESFAEIPQRFVNCLTRSTYVRPHNHILASNWELMSWIAGIVYVLFFDSIGTITHRMKMSYDGVKVIEIPPEVYHTFITPNHGVYLEIRSCAYEPEFDRTYALWAPPESSAEADAFLESLFYAKEGDMVAITC